MYQNHDSTTLLPCRIFKAHKDYLTRLLLSPDIKLLATCSADHTVRIWKIDMNEESLEAIPESQVQSEPSTPNPASQGMSQTQHSLNGGSNGSSTHSTPNLNTNASSTTVIAGGFTGIGDQQSRSTTSLTSHTKSQSHSSLASSVQPQPPPPNIITSKRPLPCDVILDNHQRWVWDCAFSADSAYLVTVCSDHYARLWELGTASIIRQYNGHHRGAVCVALNDYSNPP